MARIEGFRVENFRSLRDVTLGRMFDGSVEDVLTPLTVVIGKNGAGKSSLFDAFGFLGDCLATDVETACDLNQRGGFARLRSMGERKPITFNIRYREAPGQDSISYHLSVDLDDSARPFVASEILWPGGDGAASDKPIPYLMVAAGKGAIGTTEGDSGAIDTKIIGSKGVELTGSRELAIASLGALRDNPHLTRFRDFLKGWYLSYFQPDAARTLPNAGPQRHLNARGDNIGNVVQYMQREHGDRFKSILQRIADRIPGIKSIDTKVTEDNRVLLRFNDGGFQDPFYAQQMSDGTLKVFAYLLLLEDPDPPPFICIEEPENGLYHKLLETLAREFRAHAMASPTSSQIFVTTHQPYFLDALTPEEVWILDKGADGFSTIQHASDIELVKNMAAEGLPLGGLWYSDYLDPR